MNNEFTFTAENAQEVTDALREIFLTPLGEDYRDNYYTKERGDDDLEKILNAAQLVAGGPNITVRNMEQALRLLIDSGEIKPRDFETATPLEEPEEDTRPRDRNGKLLTDVQIRWSEYRQFAETASMADINKRKVTDPSFASFVRKNWERQLAQPVGDAVVPVGTPTSRVAPTQELIDFARKYQVEPSQNLKPRNGVVILAGEQIAYGRFLDLVNRSTACSLL